MTLQIDERISPFSIFTSSCHRVYSDLRLSVGWRDVARLGGLHLLVSRSCPLIISPGGKSIFASAVELLSTRLDMPLDAASAMLSLGYQALNPPRASSPSLAHEY